MKMAMKGNIHKGAILKMKRSSSPLAIFDELKYMKNSAHKFATIQQEQDYQHAFSFLKSYKGSQGTFNSYRREIEKLLQWCWRIANKSLNELRRDDMEAFMHFINKPPKSWIGLKKTTRFVTADGIRIPNPQWRPFVLATAGSAHKKDEKPDLKKFVLSAGSIKETFAILSSFYNYLLQEEYASMNPIMLIRQKSKFIRRSQGLPKIRRLSSLQWQYIIRTTINMAELEPERYERSLFILSALYSMYLRISELAASDRWTPIMNHFHIDQDHNWWFTTVGKGNKERQIAVSNSMLKALKRWRKYLGHPALPSISDKSPLLPKVKGNGPITSTTYIREIIQVCFDKAMEALRDDGFKDEAESLTEATVHWLRHTGISDDVKIRPREHVRDDAGHSSSAITDKYIDIELRERHRSAKNKPILDDD